MSSGLRAANEATMLLTIRLGEPELGAVQHHLQVDRGPQLLVGETAPGHPDQDRGQVGGARGDRPRMRAAPGGQPDRELPQCPDQHDLRG